MNQGIIGIASCVDWPAYYRVGDTDTTSNIFIFSITSIVLNQTYFKASLSAY